MKDGFISVAAVNYRSLPTPDDNAKAIFSLAKKAADKAAVIVFPELCVSGQDLRDMFLDKGFLGSVNKALMNILSKTAELDALIFVGAPLLKEGKVYDCIFAINKGEVAAVIPRHEIPTDMYSDLRPFSPGFGTEILKTEAMGELSIGVLPGSDINSAALFGGYKPLLVINPTATFEYAGRMKEDTHRLVALCRQRKCAVISVNAGPGGASTDGIYAGGSIIADMEGVIAKTPAYSEGIAYGVIDIEALTALRGRDSLFEAESEYMPEVAEFSIEERKSPVPERVTRFPFFPAEESKRVKFCKEVFDIQKSALMERMTHIGLKKIVLGVSGGLDSTLALLVAKEALETFGYDKKNLIAVTLPGFGTTDRTYENAVGMIKALGADFREIDIKRSVELHFDDIGQKKGVYDLTFENAQARERTQILMDLAGRESALMIGTGDLSELALGWCTFNGDHMSMYAVNGGLTKTLIREVVRLYASETPSKKLATHLLDVVDTPISPELMPAKKGKNDQKTEDKVGPYELSDFFLYYTLKYGFDPSKILRMAVYAFKGEYTQKEIEKWLGVFRMRFISQSFKRSCMPDGPAVCGLSLSPRTGMRIPSDIGIDNGKY